MSKLSAEDLGKLSAKDFADPRGRKYPIMDQADLDSVVKVVGKADDSDSVKRRVMAIAKRKNLKLPDGWSIPAKMSSDLSSDDIRQRLQDALEDEYFGSEADEASASDLDKIAASYLYVVDIYPGSHTFVYRGPEGDLLRRSYSIDSDGHISLVGAPTEVDRVTSYIPADMELGEFSEDGDSVEYYGEIFRAGSYPDKGSNGVEASADDLLKVAEKARGRTIPIKVQHRSTVFNSAFSEKDAKGQLKYCLTDVEARDGGRILFGRVRLPKWLKDAVGKVIPVSVGMSLDGKRPDEIEELSLVDKGRVPTAKLVAAFAAFAGARHSKDDLKSIQDAHDLLVSLGAECSPAQLEEDDSTMSRQGDDQAKADPLSAKAKMSTKTPQEKLATLLGSVDPKAIADAGLTPAEIASFSSSAQIDPELETRIAASEARVQELNARAEAQMEANLRSEAARFASDVIHVQRKALPAEAEELAELYIMAAKADGNEGKATFDLAGSVVKGTNVERLNSSISKRPALALFAPAIPEANRLDDTAGASRPGIMESVLAGSPAGKAVLASKETK